MKRRNLFLACLFPVFVFCAVQEQNNRPIVKIAKPLPSSTYELNSAVRFALTVSDKEDGESKYEEIHPNEVFLKVKYLQDSLAVKSYLEQKQTASEGFTVMRMSNCFNCHAFKSPLIGPSFQDISKKYLHDAANTELLVKHVKEGSLKIWGEVPMPAHPELSNSQIRDMIQWITGNAQEPDVNYYTGVEGSIQLKAPVAGVFVLTASYLDHGLKNVQGQNLEGENVVLIKVK